MRGRKAILVVYVTLSFAILSKNKKHYHFIVVPTSHLELYVHFSSTVTNSRITSLRVSNLATNNID